MSTNNSIIKIPEGAIILNGNIYIPMDIDQSKEILIKSIFYNNNKIYIKFKDLRIEETEINNRSNCKEDIEKKDINISSKRRNFKQDENKNSKL